MRRLGTLVALVVLGATFGFSSALAQDWLMRNTAHGSSTSNPSYVSITGSTSMFTVCADTITNAAYIDSLWSASNGNKVLGNGAVFNAESLLATPCANYHHFSLWINAGLGPYAQGIAPNWTGSADSVAVIRLAVQVRKYVNGNTDSTSASVWTSWAPGSVASDSSGNTLTLTGLNTGSLYPGEKLIKVPVKLGHGIISAGAAALFGQPMAQSFDLVDRNGSPFWGEYIGIRIRVLSTGLAAGESSWKPYVTSYLEMGP